MIDIAGIKSRVDLVTLVELAGGQPDKNGTGWRCACPIHHGDNPTGFRIYNQENGLRWKCFSGKCGGGDSIAFVMAWQGIEFGAACKYLSGENGIDTESMVRIAEQRAEWLVEKLQDDILQAQEAIRQLQEARRWVAYQDELKNDEGAIRLWMAAGIPREWQYIWQVGYSADYRYWDSKLKQEAHSPSMTIPMFSAGWKCGNIRHRLLQPINPVDKYRPEYSGIPAEPFVSDPDMALGQGSELIICEGEKKAMVTYLTLDRPGVQVIGIPGKTYRGVEKYGADVEQVYICLDPDAQHEANIMAGLFGDRARVIDLPYKIDDLVVQYGMDKFDIQNLLRTARRTR